MYKDRLDTNSYVRKENWNDKIRKWPESIKSVLRVLYNWTRAGSYVSVFMVVQFIFLQQIFPEQHNELSRYGWYWIYIFWGSTTLNTIIGAFFLHPKDRE